LENFESIKKLKSVNPEILSKITLDSNNKILIDNNPISGGVLVFDTLINLQTYANSSDDSIGQVCSVVNTTDNIVNIYQINIDKTVSEIGTGSSSVDLTEYIKTTVADNKYVAKETGKSILSDAEISRLSTVTNYDHTNVDNHMDNNEIHVTLEDKNKLEGISNNAKKVESSITNGNIKIDGVETKVFTPIQSDWNQTDSTKIDYIKNKPMPIENISELTNDVGFINSIPSEYVTDSELTTILNENLSNKLEVENIKQGDNITITTIGNDITINASGIGITTAQSALIDTIDNTKITDLTTSFKKEGFTSVIVGDSLSFNSYDYMISPATNAFDCYLGIMSWSFMLRDAIYRNDKYFKHGDEINYTKISTNTSVSISDMGKYYLNFNGRSIAFNINDNLETITIPINFISNSSKAVIYVASNPQNTACSFDVYNGTNLIGNYNTNGTNKKYQGYEIIPIEVPIVNYTQQNIRITNFVQTSNSPESSGKMQLRILGIGSKYSPVYLTGMGSQTSSWLLQNIQTRVLDYNPDFVTIIIGANDIALGVTQEVYESNLQSVVNSIRTLKPNCQILFLGTPSNSNISDTTTKAYNAKIRNIAINNGCYFIDCLKLFNNINSSEWKYDNIHMKQYGNEILCKTILKTIMPNGLYPKDMVDTNQIYYNNQVYISNNNSGLTTEEKEKINSIKINGDGTKAYFDDGTYKTIYANGASIDDTLISSTTETYSISKIKSLIDEVNNTNFTNANGAKTVTINAIGDTSLATTNTFAELSNSLLSKKQSIVNALANKGITSNISDDIGSYAGKINSIVQNSTVNKTKLNKLAGENYQVTLTNPTTIQNISTSVLEYHANNSGVVKYNCDFNNSDSTSFNTITDQHLIFDGMMKQDNNIRSITMTNEGAIDTYNVYSTILDKSLFYKINSITESTVDSNEVLTVSGTYNPTLVQANSDISLVGIDRLSHITWTANVTNTSKLLLIYSIDSGITWKGYDSVNHTVLNISNINDLNEIINKGISITNSNAFTQTDLDNIRNNSPKIRFAYYIEKNNMNDILQNDKITLTVDMNGEDIFSTHYSIDFDGVKTLTYTFSQNGTYTIIYTDNN